MNGSSFTCQTPSASLAKLHQFERTAKSLVLDESTAAGILAETLTEWEQDKYPSVAEIEVTVGILRHILDAAGSVKVNRLLVARILERVSSTSSYSVCLRWLFCSNCIFDPRWCDLATAR